MHWMKKLSSMTISRKFILLLLAIFLPASAIIIMSGLDQRRHEIQDAKDKSLMLVQSLAAQQEQIAIGTKLMLSTLAQLPQVQHLDSDACNALFHEINARHSFYTNISATRPDGSIFAISIPIKHGTVNLADRKHIRDAIRTRDFAAGEFILGRVSNVHSINYTFPVQDNAKNLLGVVIAGFRLDEYDAFMKPSLREGYSLTITDHAGVRLYHIPANDRAAPGEPVPPTMHALISGTSEQGTFERTSEDGTERICAFKQLRLREGAAPYLYMVVGLPKDKIEQKADIVMLRDLFFLSIAAALAMSLAWALGNFTLVKPVRRLAVAVQHFGPGDMNARTGMPHTSDELGRLAKSFDDMAGLLQQAYDDLEIKVKERTAELAATNEQLVSEIEERNKVETALRESEKRFKELTELLPKSIFEMDLQGQFTFLNQAAYATFEYAPEDLENGISWPALIAPADIPKIRDYFARVLSGEKAGSVEITAARKHGGRFPAIIFASVILSAGMPVGFRGIFVDLSERKAIEEELRRAEKLESIGQLASGIAHEINTPSQYVWDNTRFLQGAFHDLEGVQKLFDTLIARMAAGEPAGDLLEKIMMETQQADLEFLREEIPRAIEHSLEGIGHISRIVLAMKDFSHPGTNEKTSIDLNRAIESTITVTRNEWKYVADMETDFDPRLPLVPCLPGEINQVILNMIINATHAIIEAREKHGSDEKGKIVIGTGVQGDFAEIRISDTGTGIPEEIRSKIFDPFFTTKEVGKGTGQGLAISHSVILDKHGGTISFESEVGKGTTFWVRLPLGNGREQG